MSRVIADPVAPTGRDRRCPNKACPDPGSLPPERSTGYCHACATPYTFLPTLARGDVLNERYQVEGPFARGGMGWVYLARDTRLLGAPVVLKGLIEDDPEATAHEVRNLIDLAHPNVVRVLDFAAHVDAHTGQERRYIVMEYVDGLVLSEVAAEAHAGGTPLGVPMTVEHVITMGRQVLTALDYLHERGKVYCDLKPANVILRSGVDGEPGSRVKLIDLGAVRGVAERGKSLTITEDFAVPRAEIAERGMTVRSDLYTVGETLMRLLEASADRTGWGAPGVGVGVESFRRVCLRARHRDYTRRFASAAEMSDQLAAVHREIAALRDGVERPGEPIWFAPVAESFDGRLGQVSTLLEPDGRPHGGPAPEEIADRLPAPVVDEDDAAAGFLAGAAGDPPQRLLSKLDESGLRSPETALARCRALLALGDRAAAAAALADSTAPAHDWRVRWHSGLLNLAGGGVAAARGDFDEVYAAVPGEDAPKLALAFCAEAEGDLDTAAAFHSAVRARDHAVAAAAFGLTRISLARSRREQAAAHLAEVPARSRFYDAAGIAAVRVWCATLADGSRPTVLDLDRARARLAELYLDDGNPAGPAREALTALVEQAALDALLAERPERPDDPGERALRTRLEAAYRALARQAETPRQRGELVDLANRHRPVTQW
ncbi:tetratricopeptide repeat protein [Actinokineospora sp. G85]|uniref:serine/threonine-protein kinase n=1 Tax=Actinokineospora sp. G85 TaxID=3406626 RepID=UPI003C7589C5